MKAFVAGATGLVGKELVSKLLEDSNYSEVRVLSRRPLGFSHIKLKVIQTDFDRLLEHADEIQGDHLFCCLGTTIKKAGSKEEFKKVDFDYVTRIARIGIQKSFSLLSVVSAEGADENSPFFYFKVKGQLENDLMKIPYPTLQIFRPSLLLGKRQESRPGEKALGIVSKLAKPLLVLPPFQSYLPIRAEALAEAMLAEALEAKPGKFIYGRKSLINPQSSETQVGSTAL